MEKTLVGDPHERIISAKKEEVTTNQGTKKLIIGIRNVIYYAVIALMILLVIYLFQVRIKGANPTILGHQLYIVESGSMVPTLDVGSLIIIKQVLPEDLVQGDIITYGTRSDNQTVTHRIVAIQEVHDAESSISLITRGDANNADDPMPVSGSAVKGKVVGHITYLGYLMHFIRTKQGLILLMILPAAVIIFNQVFRIYKILGEKQ